MISSVQKSVPPGPESQPGPKTIQPALKAIRPGRRSLAAATTVESNECATAQEIRDYLQDKSIVVYSARSFVKEDQEKGSNELITFLEPVADKRLDFKYHKRVEAVIQKQNIEIQDSYYQIF